MWSLSGSSGTTSAASASATSRVNRLPTLRCGVCLRCLPAYGAQSGNAASHQRRQLGERLRRFRLQPHDAAAEAAHLAERGVERGDRGADPLDLGDGVGIDRVAEREQHRHVRRHLASEVAQMAGTQFVQRLVHARCEEHEGRPVDTRSLSSFGVEFVVARNPDPESSLPFLVHIPLGADGIALKVRDVWPRTTKLYCHRADGWPDEPDVDRAHRRCDRAPAVARRSTSCSTAAGRTGRSSCSPRRAAGR